MKKLIIPTAIAFIAIFVMFVVYQVKNPPEPDVAEAYTQGKVELLLYDYDKAETADDTNVEDSGEIGIHGIMIEKASEQDGIACEYVYFDKNGKLYRASSDGKITQSEIDGGEALILAENAGLDGFIIPTNYDFDTPEAGEVKIYLNTSSGVRLLTLTPEAFEAGIYTQIYAMITK